MMRTPYMRRRRQRLERKRWDDYPEDGGNADRRSAAIAQMWEFDGQPPEVRAAFAGSQFGVPLDIVRDVKRRGANNAVKAALAARGLFPCDVGTEGVIVMTVAEIDRAEGAHLRSQVYS
jgi:hypothetical protein